MSSAKDEILSKIRDAVSNSPGAPDHPNLPRHYRQSGTLDRNVLLKLFEDRLRDYNAGVYRCCPQDLRHAIEDVMNTRGKCSLLVPPGFPDDSLPDSMAFLRRDGPSYEELDHAEGVLTGSVLAIAMTGTIVLRHTEADGRRALTLLPDYHLCIVDSNQIVETVVEGIRAMASFPRLPLTTISGPSATSDIEMIRIAGVHGPRILDVIVTSEVGAQMFDACPSNE